MSAFGAKANTRPDAPFLDSRVRPAVRRLRVVTAGGGRGLAM